MVWNFAFKIFGLRGYEKKSIFRFFSAEFSAISIWNIPVTRSILKLSFEKLMLRVGTNFSPFFYHDGFWWFFYLKTNLSLNKFWQVQYILSEYFSLHTRLWTQIRPDGLIFDSFQDELKSYGKFRTFTKSRNNIWVPPLRRVKGLYKASRVGEGARVASWIFKWKMDLNLYSCSHWPVLS